MKQTQQTKRRRGSGGGRQEPLPVDPRDPDIVRAHRIALRNSRAGTGRAGTGRAGTGRAGSGGSTPSAPIRGR